MSPTPRFSGCLCARRRWGGKAFEKINWVCVILCLPACVNDRTISSGLNRRSIHTITNLQSLPPSSPTAETKAERLASPWRLHPGPVDFNPSGVFQDVRRQASQTHLLRVRLCTVGLLKTPRGRLQEILGEKSAAFDCFFTQNVKRIPTLTTASVKTETLRTRLYFFESSCVLCSVEHLFCSRALCSTESGFKRFLVDPV